MTPFDKLGNPLIEVGGCPNCGEGAGYVSIIEYAAAGNSGRDLDGACSRVCALQLEYAADVERKKRLADFKPGDVIERVNAAGNVNARFTVLDPPRTARGKLRLLSEVQQTELRTWWSPDHLPRSHSLNVTPGVQG